MRPLNCPFCGTEPVIRKHNYPTEIIISCNNDKCGIRPSAYESVTCIENPGDSKTFTPQFDLHHDSLVTKWNTRK